MKDNLLGRRGFITRMGLGAGSWLLSPMLGTLIRPALGQPSARKRFVLFVDGIGIHDEHRPTRGASETDFSLGSYGALEPYKQQITVINGMYNPFAQHLHGNHWFLTATQPREVGDDLAPSSVSIDRAIAAHLGKDTPISSLNHIAWSHKKNGTNSADGPDAPYPFDDDPIAAFGKIFGKSDGQDDAEAAARAKALLRRRKSVLDAVVADIKKAGGNLAGEEKAKLDQYLASLRDIEGNLAGLSEARSSCKAPLAPSQDQVGDELRDHHDPYRVKAHLDVIRQALLCGFTRVAVMRHNNTGLPFLGEWVKDNGEVMHPGTHQMWHGQGTFEQRAGYYGFTADNIAHLWKGLEDAPEGDGNAADNTLLAFMNSAGGKHHNGAYDYMVMMLGSAGGRFQTGRFIQLPMSTVSEDEPRYLLAPEDDEGKRRNPDTRNEFPETYIGDWFSSLGEAVGAPIGAFGDPRIARGPLPQLG